MEEPPRRRSPRAWAWVAACLAVVLGANLVALQLLHESRREAVRASLLEARLDLVERARALEAALRAGRADLEYLAGSQPLAELPANLASTDPAVVRFHRLGAEGALLRYLQAHPELERVFVRDDNGSVLVAAGRRASFPVPIPAAAAERELARGRLRAASSLGGGRGMLVADLVPGSLVSALAAGTGGGLLLDADGEPLAGTPDALTRLRAAPPALLRDVAGTKDGSRLADGWAVAASRVTPAGYEPAAPWVLARCEREEDLLAGVGTLAARYRTALGLNVVGFAAALVLGATAVRLERRRLLLEERAAREAQVRGLEARLHEADRLAAVGRTAAGLAHEVRNPLEGMRNWLTLAEEEVAASGSREAARYMGKVREGIDMLAAVVRRVLALATPSAGHFEDVCLDTVVRETVAMVSGTPTFRGIVIRVDLGLEGRTLRGDRVLLGQLLLNLLLNARDALGGHGVVRVVTDREGGRIRLSVRDSGPGIPEAMQARLFEPFASDKGSTGLGLALCGKVAALHGGTLAASTSPEGGAMLSLTLPAASATLARAAQGDAA